MYAWVMATYLEHWDRHITVFFIWAAAIFEAGDQGLRSSPTVLAKAPAFFDSGLWHLLPLIFLMASGLVWATGKVRKPKMVADAAAIVPQPTQTPAETLPGIPTLSSLLGQSPSVKFDPKQFFARAHYSPITAETENNIKLVARQSSPSDKEAFYARFIGVGLVAYFHDETWYTLWKSVASLGRTE